MHMDENMDKETGPINNALPDGNFIRQNTKTHAQRSIRHCLDMLAPFEMQSGQATAGQLQFYKFMVSLYREMYEQPEKYLVFPKPYEAYAAKQKAQALTRNQAHS